jgi:hypothetical protein
VILLLLNKFQVSTDRVGHRYWFDVRAALYSIPADIMLAASKTPRINAKTVCGNQVCFLILRCSLTILTLHPIDRVQEPDFEDTNVQSAQRAQQAQAAAVDFAWVIREAAKPTHVRRPAYTRSLSSWKHSHQRSHLMPKRRSLRYVPSYHCHTLRSWSLNGRSHQATKLSVSTPARFCHLLTLYLSTAFAALLLPPSVRPSHSKRSVCAVPSQNAHIRGSVMVPPNISSSFNLRFVSQPCEALVIEEQARQTT